jgi:hypothetical protein
MKSNRSAEFLRNMTAEAEPAPAPAPPIAARQPVADRRDDSVPPPSAAARTRAGLKHIGGYFEPETVEKVALLRARLNLDNSELIKRAIDELYARHHAKRAFGDA